MKTRSWVLVFWLCWFVWLVIKNGEKAQQKIKKKIQTAKRKASHP